MCTYTATLYTGYCTILRLYDDVRKNLPNFARCAQYCNDKRDALYNRSNEIMSAKRLLKVNKCGDESYDGLWALTAHTALYMTGRRAPRHLDTAVPTMIKRTSDYKPAIYSPRMPPLCSQPRTQAAK